MLRELETSIPACVTVTLVDDFCTLLDARRPDLIEDWYSILRCIRSAALRARCKDLTWQELAPLLDQRLEEFSRREI